MGAIGQDLDWKHDLPPKGSCQAGILRLFGLFASEEFEFAQDDRVEAFTNGKHFAHGKHFGMVSVLQMALAAERSAGPQRTTHPRTQATGEH